MDPLWAELINSDWHDYRGSGGHEDRIENPRWLSAFAARCGAPPDWRPDAAGRARLRDLRARFRRGVRALMAGRCPARADLTAINACLAAAPVVRTLEARSGGFTLATFASAPPLARVLGEAASSFAELVATGEPTRLKVCANPDCGWVMYDESRNRTRRWCDSAECGNLMKVRRYRQRHRRAPGRVR
jgi:predicted RNA-binding Zn ribbon-like protein